MFDTEKGLRMRIIKTFEYGNMQLPWVSYTQAWTFPLVYSKWRKRYSFPSGAPVSVLKIDGGILVPDPATETCGQHYDCKAGSSPCCQDVERSAKKPSKDDVKHLFWPWKLQPVMAVPSSVFTSFSVSLWLRNLGKTWQQWLQSLQGGGLVLYSWTKGVKQKYLLYNYLIGIESQLSAIWIV